MDTNDVSVVICCAGMVTRLGIVTTKALVNVCGIPLIVRQLELLKDYSDIRIVVGYQAERVIEVVNKYRKDVMFAFNYDYKDTGAAASLEKGALGAKEYVVSIDGDLLVNPEDFYMFMKYDGECIAVSGNNSDEPIRVKVSEGKAEHFTKEGNYEWPGLMKIKVNHIKRQKGHTYEMLEEIFPIDAILVRCRDIDTEEDYERAVAWVEKGCIE